MKKFLFFLGNWIPAFLMFGLFFISYYFYSLPYFATLIVIYIYLVPLLLYRILFIFFKKGYGKFQIQSNEHLLWWYGIQLQTIYSRFQFLEEMLRIFPMVYSAWLRLWGAKIGSLVFWSPQIVVADRGDISVGSSSIIGFGTKFTAHLLVKSHDKNLFIYSRISIGENAIIGAESNIGPGVEITDDVSIAALSTLLPFSVWKDSKEYNSKEK